MIMKSETLGQLAEALENAAAAVRKLESAEETATVKSADAPADGVAAPVPKPGRKAKAIPEQVDAKPTPERATKPAVPVITVDQLKAKLTELVNLGGKEKVKTIINSFGAPKLVDLDEDHYAEAYSQAIAAIAAEDAPPAEDENDLFGD